MDALPAAEAAARRDGARLVYDSHEIFMAWGDHAAQPLPVRAVVGRWERRLAGRATAVVTVNDEIADVLRRRLDVQRIVVVYNTPPRWTPPDPPRGLIRNAAGIPGDARVVLCHGGFQAGRGLEETTLAILEPGLESAHMVFLGYRLHILDTVLEDSRFETRVHVLDAVPPAELLDWVVDADVDVMAILPTDLNHILSTPNKLFESLAAGVPVVSSDLPVRHRIICDDPLGPLGALCDPTQPTSIAAAIRSILDAPAEERARLRARCLAAAHARWNWETESRGLVDLYDDLGRRHRPSSTSLDPSGAPNAPGA
jgi:glycosyltransferase involved in cell wall biosynthesis